MKLGDLSLLDVRKRLRGEGLRIRIGPFVCHFNTRLADVAESVYFGYTDFPLVDLDDFADYYARIDVPWGLRRWWRPHTLYYLDNEQTFCPYPVRLSAALFEWGLNWCFVVQPLQYLMIHSAVLERDGRAVIMAGRPGAGKSTLCAALMLRGWRLLSDELALIRPDDGLLMPLPRPVSLKNDAIDVVQQFSADAVIGQRWEDTVKGTVALLRPPTESVDRIDEPAEPAWVIFPKYAPDSPARSKRHPKGSSLLCLADNAFNHSTLGVDGFEILARLVENSDCYEFRYSDLNEAVERFDQLPLPEHRDVRTEAGS